MRRHAGAPRRRRRQGRPALRVAGRERFDQRSGARAGRRSRTGTRARAARGRQGAGHRGGHRARPSGRRAALGARSRAARADRLDDQRRIVRTRSSPSPRTASTGTSITSASTSGPTPRCKSLGAEAPPLYYVTMAPGRHARGGQARQSRRAGRRRIRASGASPPRRSATRPRRQPSSSTSQTGSRASSPRFAAIGPRWDPPTPSRRSIRSRPGAGSASSTFAGRRSAWSASVLERIGRPGRELVGEEGCRAQRDARASPLPVLRRPSGARHLAVPPARRRRDRGRHPGMPLLHLSDRVGHPDPAPPACRHDRARSDPGGAAGSRAPHDVRPRGRARRPPPSRRSPRPRPRPTAIWSRRSAPPSKAATSSIASPTRPTSWPTPSCARSRGRCSSAAAARSTSAEDQDT